MILATNNQGKIREVKSIFEDFEIYSLKEKGIFVDVVEEPVFVCGNVEKEGVSVHTLTERI